MYGVPLQTQTDLVEKREETFYSVFAVLQIKKKKVAKAGSSEVTIKQ